MTADPAPGGFTAVPLPARGPREEGVPLFETLPADATGIDFVHRWEPRTEYEADQLGTAFAGGAVAIGDFDGDGWPDVFLTRPHGGARLYRNLGGFRFEDATSRAGLEPDLERFWASGAALVDLDGDGDLDLHVCGYRDANRLFLNRGDGTFEERSEACGLAFDGASIAASFVDYDRDGDLDVHLLTNRLSGEPAPDSLEVAVIGNRVVVPPEHAENIGGIVKADGSVHQILVGQADHLFRNEGGSPPRFVDVSREAGLSGNWHGLSATWWDFDDDGWPDLYVANDFFGPDQLWRNNGDGTFTDVIAQAVPNTPWFSMGSDAGDLDNDGRLDFIASDMAATTHYKQKVNMGDMDETGWFLELPLPRQYMRNAVYVNTGTPRFLELAHLTGMAGTDWTWAVKILDLDEDGRQDVFFSNGMTRQFFHADLRAAVRARHAATGRNEWEKEDPQREPNRCFRNDGDLAFTDVSSDWGLGHVGVSFGAASGDLDLDGDLDLVVNHFGEPAGVHRNGSASPDRHRITIALRGSGANRQGIGARVRVEASGVRQVRFLNPVRGFMGCDQVIAHFGLGDAASVDRLVVDWPSGVRQVLENLEADHHYVIAEPAGSGSAAPEVGEPEAAPMFVAARFPEEARHVDRPFDDFARQPLLPNRLSTQGPAVALADIDGDGDPDAFFGGGAGQPARLLENDGPDGWRGRFIPAFEGAVAACEDVGACFFDADGDGDADLYVVSGSVECEPGDPVLADRLYLNNGRGDFHEAPAGTLPAVLDSGSCAASADIDGDGDLDLFVGSRVVPGRYPLSTPSRILRNESDDSGCRFVDATVEVAPVLTEHPSMVTGAVWADLDGDGAPDLALAREYAPIQVLRNESGRLVDCTETLGFAASSGWWNALAAADVDADGDLDLAAGNFGWNTKYHPSPEHPQQLYFGDFEGNGEHHLVEAHLDGEVLVPNRGRSCSSQAMPFLKERFPTFHEFAISSLEGIYSRPALDRALRLEANDLATGVWINGGAAGFAFHPLPRLAQVAPTMGIAFLHADDDEQLDLYLSQNFYGPQRETGRMAGGVGLLLRGAGDGTFLPVPPTESGIVVPDDARGAVAADLDGDGRDDLAIAVNGGVPRMFLSGTRAGAR